MIFSDTKKVLQVLMFLIPSLSFSAERDLRFQRACDRGTKITISAVGDILLHGGLQQQAYSRREGFISLWEEAVPYFRRADLSYANLEGPVADGIQCNGRVSPEAGKVQNPSVERRCSKRDGDGNLIFTTPRAVYTGYPRFNYSSLLVDDLVDSGIDIVSTANNHSLDRSSVGVDATISALDQGGLAFTGTRESSGGGRPWYKITRARGKRIAWISCTYGTNGVSDRGAQVLNCFSGDQVSRIIQQLKTSVDAVIITPHWGYEYNLAPNREQGSYAKKWLDAGAVAIIGSHPHVIQPWEKYTTKDGRETLIVYSLGNFVSGQGAFVKKATIILFFGITVSRGQAWINGVRYVPAYMVRSESGRRLYVGSVYRSSVKDDLLPFLSEFYGEERIVAEGERPLTNFECR